MRRWFITGGAGFIGSHLCDSLLAAGDSITVLDDFSTGSRNNLAHHSGNDKLQVVEGSVQDFSLVDQLMAEADHCAHLASIVGVQLVVEQPLATLSEILGGSQNVLKSAVERKVPVLYASTSEVYGKRSDGLLSEDADLTFGSPSRSRWSYAIAKTAGESLAHAYVTERNADIRMVRFFNTVGPRQTGSYGMVVPRFVTKALAGEDLPVYGDGEQVRCFGHVHDAVAAIVALFQTDAARGEMFNVGNPSPITISELAQKVIDQTGSSSTIKKIPYSEAFGAGFEELGNRYPNIDKLNSLTGWSPKLSIDDAIADVIKLERVKVDNKLNASVND